MAAVVTCVLLYVLWQQTWYDNTLYLPALTIIITLLGIYVGDKVEPAWGKDSSRVVIDEVAGMMITMLFIPTGLCFLVAGLIFFRFFDIVKPLYIRNMEKYPGGKGVMFDDLLAGVYANILLWVVVIIDRVL